MPVAGGSRRLFVLLVVVIGVYLVFRYASPFRHRTTTYAEWAARHGWALAGEVPDARGLIADDNVEAIMEDYVRELDLRLRERAGRSPASVTNPVPAGVRLAWRSGRVLVVVHPTELDRRPFQDEVDAWASGLEGVRNRAPMEPADRAFYEFALRHFDMLVIQNGFTGKASGVSTVTLPLKYGDTRDRDDRGNRR